MFILSQGIFEHTAGEGGTTVIQYPNLAVMILAFAAVILVPYLLGSINSAIIVSRLLHGEDIRTKGSGNAGLTNIMRTYGKREVILTLLGDMLKMILSILFAGILFGLEYVRGFSCSPFCYLAALFCIIGHIWPVYYRFRGGKGVLCTATAVLVLSPFVFLIVIPIFFLLVLGTHYISLSSIIGAALYPLLLNGMWKLVFGQAPSAFIILTSLLIFALILYCHRANIRRLLNHEENRFYPGKKHKKQAEADGESGKYGSAESDESDK